MIDDDCRWLTMIIFHVCLATRISFRILCYFQIITSLRVSTKQTLDIMIPAFFLSLFTRILVKERRHNISFVCVRISLHLLILSGDLQTYLLTCLRSFVDTFHCLFLVAQAACGKFNAAATAYRYVVFMSRMSCSVLFIILLVTLKQTVLGKTPGNATC